MNYDEYKDYIYTDGFEQEIEEIVDERVKSKIQAVIDEYGRAVDRLDILQSSVRSKGNELKQLEEKLEYIKNDDKYNMPRMYINKFVKEHTGGYAPGDKVWVISSKYERVICDCCEGTGKLKVNLPVGERIVNCPDCRGYGFNHVAKKVIEEKKVERVDLRLCFTDRVNLWNNECVYCYNCDGSIKPEYIFRTKEEAEQALKEMEEKK